MERVAAIDRGGESLAVPFSRLREDPVANEEVGGESLVVFWSPGTASSVDQRTIAQGRDVGSSGVFKRELEGRSLTFEPGDQPGVFRDRETGSTWSITGRATAGELQGKALTAIPHGNHFWFAWAVFKPDTRIWEGPRG